MMFTSYSKPNCFQSGFTLIEIIIAMAILAITGLAINTALVRHVDAAGKLENKLIANWVASNAIAEARIAVQYKEPPVTSGTVEMAGREWRFNLIENSTTDINLNKLNAEVFLFDGETPITVMDGYYSNLEAN